MFSFVPVENVTLTLCFLSRLTRCEEAKCHERLGDRISLTYIGSDTMHAVMWALGEKSGQVLIWVISNLKPGL